MKVYYTATNGGDGSASVSFFETQACIDKLEEADPETYGQGEGGSSFEVPDGTVFTGIEIHTEEAVDAAIVEGEDSGYVSLY